MFKIKKIQIIACALAAGVSVSACGQANTSPGADTSVAAQTAASASAAAADVFNGRLSIACFSPGRGENFLNDAAQRFMQMHTGVTVTVTAFSKPPEVRTGQDANGNPQAMVTINENQQAQEEADYIESVSTELMSGKGADIYMMDILPYQKYTENGQLVDLNPFMDGDQAFNKADYNMNVLNPAKYNGKQYIFPLAYSFNIFMYNSKLLNAKAQDELAGGGPFTYEQLIGIGKDSFEANKANGDTSFMFPMHDPQEVGLMNEMMIQDNSRYLDVIGKKADFGQDFINLLKFVKDAADKGYIQKSAARTNSGENVIVKGGNPNQRFYFMNLYSDQLLWMYYDKETGGSHDDGMRIAGLSAGSGGKGQYQYEQAVSVNANSAQKALAWEFIKFMEENAAPQSLDIRGSLVYKPGDAELVKNTITGAIKSQSGQSQTETPASETAPANLTPEEQKAFDDYMAALDSYAKDIVGIVIPPDASIQNMIETELKSYFTGEKSAEDAAASLQNRIDLYLNE